MNRVWIGAVVEGQGEVSALPVLIRRIAAVVDPALVVEVPRPVRVSRGRMGTQFDDLSRALERAAASIQAPGALFILLDADDDEDCPAQLGPALLQRAVAARGAIPIAVVLAKREYEAWFLAAAESLVGKRGLPADLKAPPNPEDIRDAKGWLRARTPASRKYSPTADQAALTASFDFDQARSRSDSFAKCFREMVRLLTILHGPPPPTPAGPGQGH